MDKPKWRKAIREVQEDFKHLKQAIDNSDTTVRGIDLLKIESGLLNLLALVELEKDDWYVHANDTGNQPPRSYRTTTEQ
jgi:hypothetical protein